MIPKRHGRSMLFWGVVLGLIFVLSTSIWGAGFLSGLAKRRGRGPYAAAPILQGDWNTASGDADTVTIDRGNQIAGTFYEHIDTAQGYIGFWLTPEWDWDDDLTHNILIAGTRTRVLKTLESGANTLRFHMEIFGTWFERNLTFTPLYAGNTYRIEIRWDSRNPIRGTDHVCISIDDDTDCGHGVPWTPEVPYATIFIGSDESGQDPANAIIEGLTISRTPYFDGTDGIDLGLGDVIASTDDKTLMTGSWDVLFHVPTDGTTGALTSGTGQSWSHPHGSNLLPGNGGTGGFMSAGNAVTDGWSNEGSPTSVLALANAEKIFSGGYKTTSNASNQGLYQDITVAPGDDWIVRALAHSDGTCQPKIDLYDQTNTASIGSLTGTTSSTRAAPDVFVLAGEAPPGSNTLRIKLVNTAASGTCYWHQTEVLSNDFSNPSMETGAGNPWIPTGWVSFTSLTPLAAGDSVQETVNIHSGGSAIRFNYSGGFTLRGISQSPTFTVGKFYSLGAFLKDGPVELFLRERTRYQIQKSAPAASATIQGTSTENPAGFTFYPVIFRTDAAGIPDKGFGWRGPVSTGIVDDTYRFALNDVALTVTPTGSSGSVENGSELRIDGRDTYYENDTGLTTSSGTLDFDWRPRHDAANGVAFAESTNDDAYILSMYGDADDFIDIYWDDPNIIRMNYSMAGATDTGTWDASGAITRGSLYTLEVSYTGGGDMIFRAGGVARITLSGIPAAFGTTPSTVNYGSDSSGTQQGDASIDLNTTTAVELSSFEAQGRDGAVELLWTTSSELDNLGFHLYRAEAGGSLQRVTAQPIPGLGSSPRGASYRYLDPGLVNGVSYSYLLEDIETSGRTDRHGPVAATPTPRLADDTEVFEDSEDSTRIAYGNPAESSLREIHRNRRGVWIELRTGGFYAEPRGDGSVAIEIPGFASCLEGDSAPALPLIRHWVQVPEDRNVEVEDVRALDQEILTGLRLSEGDGAELLAHRDGTVRTYRRRARRAYGRRELFPSEQVRLATTAFQGDVQKAFLELAPIRWDGTNRRLLFSRRLLIHLAFGEVKRERGRSVRRQGAPNRNAAAHLSTREAGLYRVGFREIFGPRRRAIAVGDLLLSRLGKAVAFHVEPNADRFGPGSTLFFLSEGEEVNPYGTEAVYELEVGRGGERMRVGFPDSVSGSTSFHWKSSRYEEDHLYQAALLDAPDLWLWDLLFAPARKEYRFTLENPSSTVTGDAHLKVWLQGGSDASVAADHHVRVYVNGSFVAEKLWKGKSAETIDVGLSPSSLRSGGNILALENVGDTEADYSMVFLNRFEIEYPRDLFASNGVLEGRFGESGRATVTGVGSHAHVLDVTRSETVWMTSSGAVEDGIQFDATEGHRYLVVGDAAVREPVVRRVGPTRLRRERPGVSYLAVGPEPLIKELEPLLDWRRRQGLSVEAVSLEQIYSEFGFGESRPEAIRDFLSYAYHHWQGPRLRYILLAGDGTFDFKDAYGTGVRNQVPPMMIKTRFLWTASDWVYASVNGDDLLPDVAIGRLPAASSDELRVMVSKILAYESETSGGGSPIVLVADDADRAGNFEQDAEAIASSLSNERPLHKIYLGRLGDAATRQAIAAAFDEGATLLSYLGHGGIQLWGEENLFNNEDVALLAPQSNQPLVVTMNCLNGYFHFPFFDSLGERLVKVEDKGAIAAFSPSGMSLHLSANIYHRALLRELLQSEHERLGDAILAAQSAYTETGALPELLSIYHLFGDPALVLR